jgi:hypothetical protein
MADTAIPTKNQNENAQAPPARSKDEIALELMKFIAVTTSYGKSGQGSAGFSGKPSVRSAEEHAEALIELFERCRKVVNQ